MDALDRFYRDVKWTGRIEPGGMGPGTPTMIGRGSGTHRRIHDGLWIVGDYQQDQLLEDGTFVLTWRLHWVTGWDEAAGEYRAVFADNYGSAGTMRGHLDGDRLVYETLGEAPVRLRLTFDASDPALLVWTNEASANGGPWMRVEQYRMKPSVRL